MSNKQALELVWASTETGKRKRRGWGLGDVPAVSFILVKTKAPIWLGEYRCPPACTANQLSCMLESSLSGWHKLRTIMDQIWLISSIQLCRQIYKTQCKMLELSERKNSDQRPQKSIHAQVEAWQSCSHAVEAFQCLYRGQNTMCCPTAMAVMASSALH